MAGVNYMLNETTLKHGVIVRTSGNNTLSSPLLVIQKAKVDVIVDALENTFKTVKN